MDLSQAYYWRPFSDSAYGANALYIPDWGVGRSFEFIFHMVQVYPDFKVHPVLDVWHMYHQGRERFQHQWNYRVTAWETDLRQGAWSFLYLPDENNDVRAYFRFSAGKGKRLRLDLEFINPSDQEREWQLASFFCRPETHDLLDFQELSLDAHKLVFQIEGQTFTVRTEAIQLASAAMDDSNYFVNFPFNVENSMTYSLHNDRSRQRYQFKFKPIVIPGQGHLTARLDIFPDMSSLCSPEPEFPVLPHVAQGFLPYAHEIWEAQHNQAYLQELNGTSFTALPVPAKQWGNYWFWDSGFVQYAATDFDPDFALQILASTPDPAVCKSSHGSYVPTCLLAWWKQYCDSGSRHLLETYYPLMRRIMNHWLNHAAASESDLFNKSMGVGSDDNPCSCYCSNFLFSWGYHRTLERNAHRQKLECIDMEATSYVLRMLRIMRLVAWELGDRIQEEACTLQIERTEEALETHWSDTHGCFLYRAGGEDHLLDIVWLGCYDPIFAGTVKNPARLDRMLQNITNPRQYWTPYGLTSVAMDNPNYRPEGYPNGCIWSPQQFFYWRGFYDIGRCDLAIDLITRYLTLFESIHEQDLMCWEQFRAENGAGSGNARFSSFVTPIVSMWKSRHQCGYVTAGFDTVIRKVVIAEGNSKATLTASRPFEGGRSSISIVLNPNTTYRVCADEKTVAYAVSDGYGFFHWTQDFMRSHTYEIVLVAQHT